MAKRPQPPASKPSDWPPYKTYHALQKQLAELAALKNLHWKLSSADEQAWKNLTLNILTHGFGEDSNNVKQFHSAKWAGQHRLGGMTDGQIQHNYNERIIAFDALLKSTLAELELMGIENEDDALNRSGANMSSRNVFIVHGRDEAVTVSVARFLEKLELVPIILHEQPNKGRTIIEKFEAHADVSFAIVLLTPDDVGGLASSGTLSPRARQNVILELGYFIGRLGRPRVCGLYVEDVELPSDIHGVAYIPYDGAQGWRLRLAAEIKAAGMSIDLNRV